MNNNSENSGDRGVERERPDPQVTVVGIGASAGGLAALRVFFDQVSDDSGLAFVVVVHLSPEHESHLSDLLQSHVKIPVQQVSSTTKILPDRVYVIPPGSNISTIDTHLRLSDLEEHRGERAPIDHFFRTLARAHEGRAVGVILTGTGSDGTLGIRDIKASGGFAVVQDPSEAEYDGMPQSAIATGLVDLILPVAEIPTAILKFTRTQPLVPALADGEDFVGEQRTHLTAVFALVRARSGRDFSRYKLSTMLRRISRRMQIHNVADLAPYLEILRESPDETRALADDLLVSVTSFFRDREVYEKLERDVIPALLVRNGDNPDLRVWSVGCATGEEAYSIAILILEEAARRALSPNIQIFASDLHEDSLAKAREGFIPVTSRPTSALHASNVSSRWKMAGTASARRSASLSYFRHTTSSPIHRFRGSTS